MTYAESIQYLFNLQKFGMKFGLLGIRKLLKYLGNPENKFPSIHIAGTNGKGSTASMIASVFTAAGYKTGLYTSPHLIKFNERIRINGRPIASKEIKRLVNKIIPEVEKNRSTFFETVTAIAFKFFEESKVDIAVIETGLGGRLDATNVIKPLVSVITSIGLEHTQILGSSIEKISFEKGGIIKRGVPCVTGAQQDKAVRVLRNICEDRKSEFIHVKPIDMQIRKSDLNGMVIDATTVFGRLNELEVALAGNYQALNTLVALTAIEVVVRGGDFKIDEKDKRKGLKNIYKYTGLQARLSVVRKSPLIIVDVAHNPAAVCSLCSTLKRIYNKRFNILIGLMKDKDYKKIIAQLKPIANCIYAVTAKTERSRNSIDLYEESKKNRMKSKRYRSVAEGVSNLIKKTGQTPILITGSHFVVGEALAFLNREKYLTINQ